MRPCAISCALSATLTLRVCVVGGRCARAGAGGGGSGAARAYYSDDEEGGGDDDNREGDENDFAAAFADPSPGAIDDVADGDDELLGPMTARTEDGPNVLAAFLEAADAAVRAFADERLTRSSSKVKRELVIPPFLDKPGRSVIHDVAQRLGLMHKTRDTAIGVGREMVISFDDANGLGDFTGLGYSARQADAPPRRVTGTRASIELLFDKIDADWQQGTFKADALHWMRNVYLIARSKDSPLCVGRTPCRLAFCFLQSTQPDPGWNISTHTGTSTFVLL